MVDLRGRGGPDWRQQQIRGNRHSPMIRNSVRPRELRSSPRQPLPQQQDNAAAAFEHGSPPRQQPLPQQQDAATAFQLHCAKRVVEIFPLPAWIVSGNAIDLPAELAAFEMEHFQEWKSIVQKQAKRGLSVSSQIWKLIADKSIVRVKKRGGTKNSRGKDPEAGKGHFLGGSYVGFHGTSNTNTSTYFLIVFLDSCKRLHLGLEFHSHADYAAAAGRLVSLTNAEANIYRGDLIKGLITQELERFYQKFEKKKI